MGNVPPPSPRRSANCLTPLPVRYSSSPEKNFLTDANKQARQQPQRQMTVEGVSSNMPNLLMVEQDWIRKHPEVVMDRAINNRLTVYFDEEVT
jgi:hypothetical protein